MGLEVSKIDAGLFICGVEALDDIARMEQLGITHILNVAQSSLYTRSYRNVPRKLEDQLATKLPAKFTVKVMNTHDNARQDLSPLFDEMSEFIAEGRAAGGVVVHCAAGISRATAACVAYMVQREGLSVNAAFRKIFHIRPQVYPNEGFWRQLRDLESVLLEKGVALRELREGELRVLSEAEAPHNTDGPTVEDTIKQLDNAAGRTASFTSIALTATVTLSPTAGPAQAVELLKKWNENPATGPGIVITDYSTDDHSVSCRVRLVASRRSSAAADVRGALDEALGGPQHVEGIAVEGEIPLHTAGPSPNPKNATGNSRTVVAH